MFKKGQNITFFCFEGFYYSVSKVFLWRSLGARAWSIAFPGKASMQQDEISDYQRKNNDGLKIVQ